MDLQLAASVTALCGGFFCSGVLFGRKSGRRHIEELNRMRADRGHLYAAGRDLVRSIQVLREKFNGGAAYAQTAVNNWTQVVLRQEVDQ